jgi:RNA polymerase sigma-70 factor (ECF subfamily)
VIAAVDSGGLPGVNSDMGPACETLDTGVLFATYHDRIYRYLLHMVKNPAEAEDLTQETFLRAYRHGDSVRDPLAIRGWLYRIATHACLDRLRQRHPVISMHSQPAGEQLRSAATEAPSALEITERRETSACVQRCLDFLPDKYRAVILLHEAYSLTAPEIAKLLGVTVTTVKIRLHRARRNLQQVMKRACAISTDHRGVPVCQPDPKLPDKT